VINKRKAENDIIAGIFSELKKSRHELGDCSKYLKRTNETIYDASQVRLYLSSSEIGISKQSSLHKSKVIIDTTNVHLIKSAEYTDRCHRTSHPSVNFLNKLTNSCQPHYDSCKQKELDEKYGANDINFENKLEELDEKDGANDVNYENNISQKKSFLSCPFSSVITIDKAINFYPKPRIITESKYPFPVIHINGRFTNLTKIQSNEIIGQSLSKLVLSPNVSKLLFDCMMKSEIGGEAVVDVFSRKTNSSKEVFCAKQNSIRCSTLVFPVVSNLVTKTGARMKVTHFALELKKCRKPPHTFPQI
jgi:hypothetical protein